jgi:PKHD-type hydroxylase
MAAPARISIMYNKYLTAVAQVPAVFTADECRQLIELPLPSTDARINVAAGVESSAVDHEVRRTKDKPVPPDPENAWIFKRIGNLVSKLNGVSYKFQLSDLVTINILEYQPTGFYDWHVDLGLNVYATRKVSLVTFLTPPEDYEGGELCFMDRGEPLKLSQGATVLFPSYLIHKVAPVTRGTRFSLVSWVHGPSFT